MDPDRWRCVAHLYELVLEREPVERGTFLAAACAGDDDLRREVESLIAHDDAPVLLDRPMLEAAAAVLEDSRDSLIRSSTRGGASAPSWTDDGAATVTVVREPQSSPLHPIQVLLRRRLLTLTAAISNSLFGGLPPRLLTAYLFNLGIWMVYASALAIYGSHRINVLHTQALEARKLGQYQLKRLLGVGGMGEVYLAEHLLLRRPCAIKLIRIDRAGDAESLLRFEREVQATATLTHPNTVQVYDYGHTDDGTFYYVMEYLPGLTLNELVQRHGPAPASRTIHLLRQICGALREAHARGLVHRDIKPSNIIVCERGGQHDVAKLLDFGIVQRLELLREGRQVFRGEVMGTPIFMSPEQASGTEPVDARSDIYSLGAVAYFLLTGVPPFLRATAAETLAAHMCDAVVPPDRIQPDVHGDLQAIVLRCLSKHPDQRYQSAYALNDALARCASSRP